MKKLVMLCAIVAAAVSVHAASFEWGGAIAAEDGMATVGSSATAYLLYSDTAFGSITSFDTDSKTTNAGGTLRQTHAITSGEAGNYVFSDTYNNSDYTQMNGYYAVVMVDGANMYYNTFNVTEFTSATTPTQKCSASAASARNPYTGGSQLVATARNRSSLRTGGFVIL